MSAPEGTPHAHISFAIVTGGLCIIGGFLTVLLGTREPITVHFALAVVSLGFAIILGAFGTRATGHFSLFGVWTVVGPGAIAFALIFVLEFFLKPGFTKLGRIEISHPDYFKVADLRIIDGQQPLYEYRDSTTKSMHFIMLKEKFMNPRVYIQVDTTEKIDGGEQFIEMFGDGDEIVRRHMGDKWEESAQWDFDYPNRIVKDGDTVIFKRVRDQSNDIIPIKKAELSSYRWLGIFNVAADARPTENNDSGLDLAMSVHNLTDDDPRVRRNARDLLIELGPISVPAMLEAWQKDHTNYKTKLGVVIVLNDILRNNTNMARKMSDNLTNDDIKLLVYALSDTDKTVRAQATEFLYFLKDKRIIDGSLEAVRNNSNEN